MILPRHSRQKWPENTLFQSGYGADDLAAMLVTSQYLQRLALRHGEDVGPCLNGQAASQINIAKTHFISVNAIGWRRKNRFTGNPHLA